MLSIRNSVLGAVASLALSIALATSSGSAPEFERAYIDTTPQIAANNWAPWPTDNWTYATPWSQGMDARGIVDAFRYAQGKESDALLVVRNGCIVAEWYSNDWKPNTRRRTHSLAKSMTSTIVGMLIEEGAIGSINDSASLYIPDWRESWHDRITIRNLLSMDSGLKDRFGSGLWRASDQNAHAIAGPMEAVPGQIWKYQQSASQALSPLILQASGMQPESYARTQIWDVIGMSDAYWAQDDVGNTLTYTSVYATAREWAKFGYLYLRNGNWDGQQIVPERWVRESTRPSQRENTGYGYQWWLNHMGEEWPDVPADAFQAEGASENHVYVVPSLNLVVIRLGDSVGDRWRDNTFLGKICQAVR